MKNGEYWKKRFLQIEKSSYVSAAQTIKFIEDQYRTASGETEKQIAAWYTRFAKNNGVSITEARKLLSASELKELKWEVKDYIKHGRENGISADWSKELENASAKFHISRLEALKLQMQMVCDKLFGKQINSVTELMKNTYLDGYYRSAYEIQKGLSVGWNIAAIDERKLAKIVNRPWATDGQNFSDRIWTSRKSLINEIHQQLTRDILLGRSPDSSIKAVAKKFNVSKSKAGRLVMTESTYFGSESQKDCFKDLDVERFEVVETLDGTTCDICSAMDGQVFAMKDFKSGVTAPPFHPWCRGCTAPYFDDNFTERAARGADGKTYYVPSDMKYPQWKEKFVDNGGKSDIIEVESDNIDFMKSPFTDKKRKAVLGNTETLTYGDKKIPLRRVMNSHYKLYADESISAGDKVIRLYEGIMNEAYPYTKDYVEIPPVVLIDFDKYGIGPGKGYVAIGGYSDSIRKIMLNTEFNTSQKILEFVGSGMFANASVMSTMRHEIGHKYYYDSIRIIAKKHDISEAKARRMMDKAISELIKKEITQNHRDISQVISFYAGDGYGDQNYSEVTAECFASFDFNLTSKIILDEIERVKNL